MSAIEMHSGRRDLQWPGMADKRAIRAILKPPSRTTLPKRVNDSKASVSVVADALTWPDKHKRSSFFPSFPLVHDSNI